MGQLSLKKMLTKGPDPLPWRAFWFSQGASSTVCSAALTAAPQEWGLRVPVLCAENVMCCGRWMVVCPEPASVGCTVDFQASFAM